MSRSGNASGLLRKQTQKSVPDGHHYHRQTMSSSCQALLDALKDCLLHSDCVLKQGHLPSTCLKEHMDELPEQCRSLRKATYDCKRGMVCTQRPMILSV
jgi:hypothetical protein